MSHLQKKIDQYSAEMRFVLKLLSEEFYLAGIGSRWTGQESDGIRSSFHFSADKREKFLTFIVCFDFGLLPRVDPSGDSRALPQVNSLAGIETSC